MWIREVWEEITILDAKAANGIGLNMFVKDYKNIVLTFATDGWWTAALTVKFQGSMSDTPPDFSAAQSVTNFWEYIECADLEGTWGNIAWWTWIAVSWADDYRLVELNVDALHWINVIVSWRTAWSVTVKARWYSN